MSNPTKNDETHTRARGVIYSGLSPVARFALMSSGVGIFLVCVVGIVMMFGVRQASVRTAEANSTRSAAGTATQSVQLAQTQVVAATATSISLTQGVDAAEAERAEAATDAARPTNTPRPTALPTDTPTATPLPERPIRCPGAPPIHMEVGDRGRVLGIDGHQIRLRTQPSIRGATITSIRIGQEFTVLDGPECADDFTWFLIEFEGGLRGYMAEGFEGTYYIEPIR